MKAAKAFEALKGPLGYKNVMQAPRLEKVVVSIGVGKIDDKAKKESIYNRLALITGQKPSPRPAKQSIASFKLRQGEIIGYQVTLRGERMHFGVRAEQGPVPVVENPGPCTTSRG